MIKILTFFVVATSQINILFAAPEVLLPNGLIRGRTTTTIRNTSYHVFEKIPYASPPVGELRFKAPQPPQNWDEPLDTVSLDVTCYDQRSNTDYESEDCLFINVYTPQLPNGDSNNNDSLAVLVFVHGGGFVSDAARNYYPDRFVDQNVIFVTFDYRMGPFGFLSTQDDIITGNFALKDQHMAIKWTHDNIHLFGGDPEQITISGESAGSASCSYQLLNQNSQCLFRSVILQSGTFLNPWAFQRRSREIAFNSAAFLNETFKTNNDSKALLKFLQNVDAKSIDKMSEEYFSFEDSPQDTQILQGFYWAPVVEEKNPDAFITKKMYGLLQAGNIVSVPILVAMNSEEYVNYARDRSTFQDLSALYDENLAWIVPNDMGVTDPTQRSKIGTKIREIYTGGEPFADHLGDGVRHGSDTAFTRAIIKFAELYSQFAPTYFYQFSYDGTLGHLGTQYEGAEHVGHGQEVKYLFCQGTACDLNGYPETDQIASDRLIKIWTDFTKYQNPTPEPSEILQNANLTVVGVENGDYFYLDIGENVEVKNRPKESTYGKWNELYSSLGYDDFDTY